MKTKACFSILVTILLLPSFSFAHLNQRIANCTGAFQNKYSSYGIYEIEDKVIVQSDHQTLGQDCESESGCIALPLEQVRKDSAETLHVKTPRGQAWLAEGQESELRIDFTTGEGNARESKRGWSSLFNRNDDASNVVELRSCKRI